MLKQQLFYGWLQINHCFKKFKMLDRSTLKIWMGKMWDNIKPLWYFIDIHLMEYKN